MEKGKDEFGDTILIVRVIKTVPVLESRIEEHNSEITINIWSVFKVKFTKVLWSKILEANGLSKKKLTSGRNWEMDPKDSFK